MLRRTWGTLMVLFLVLFGLTALPAPAQATSDYDDLFNVTPSLYVYTDGDIKSQTMDVRQSWWHDFQQSYAKRAAQNMSWPSSFVPAFGSILEEGSWAVYTQSSVYGKTINFFGTSDPNASCAFVTLSGIRRLHCSAEGGSTIVGATYFTHNSFGGNGCTVSGQNHCSNNGMSVYSAPWVGVLPGSGIEAFWSMDEVELAYTEFYLWSFDMAYPANYNGETIPEQQNLEYVALGDSFSSGEGVEPFLNGTDEASPNENRCHRSEDAYPMLLDKDSTQKTKLNLATFVACSGATTSNITTTGQWNEPAQIEALSEDTDVVTLTVGGNDAGFESVLRACLQSIAFWVDPGWGCSSDSNVTDPLQERLDALNGTALSTVYTPESAAPIHSIKEVIESIASAAPNASIQVAGYPHLFGSILGTFEANVSAPGYGQCDVAFWGGVVAVSYTDAQWINDRTDALNSIIEDAVEETRGQGVDVTYVSPDSFETHALCDSSASYINALFLEGNFSNPDVVAKSFHPKDSGILAYKALFASSLQ